MDIISQIIDMVKLIFGVALGSVIGAKLMEWRINRFIRKLAKKYGITEHRIKSIFEALAEFFGVEI